MLIAVVGAGAWGTALAAASVRAGHSVVLLARDPDHAARLGAHRENRRHLPGMRLPDAVTATADAGAVAAAALILLAVPAQAVRDAATRLAPVAAAGVPVVACAKGIERATGLWMTDLLAACLPGHPAAVLSGPSFALDVARGLPTAVTLAAAPVHDGLAASLAAALAAPTFRLYHTDDVRGVEIGGAVKNVLAIASGIVAGRGLGASAQAALVARSFAELARFGRACGARPETLTGLSGLGDLVLTCSAPQSRNYGLGHALGRGAKLADALGRGELAEGVFTASILVDLARRRGVDMPVAASVDAILAGRLDVDRAIDALLSRPQKAES